MFKTFYIINLNIVAKTNCKNTTKFMTTKIFRRINLNFLSLIVFGGCAKQLFLSKRKDKFFVVRKLNFSYCLTVIDNMNRKI